MEAYYCVYIIYIYSIFLHVKIVNLNDIVRFVYVTLCSVYIFSMIHAVCESVFKFDVAVCADIMTCYLYSSCVCGYYDLLPVQ